MANLKYSAARICAYYDRRMGIEEQLRDTKGCRFGVKLAWTQFRHPDHLGRFALLVGVAILLWTVTGRAAAKRDASLRYPHPSKGPRCSYLTIGMRHLDEVMLWLRLTKTNVVSLIPPPKLRMFTFTNA